MTTRERAEARLERRRLWTALGLKKHKPCKRCYGMPAGRDGYCKACRKELATIGASVK